MSASRRACVFPILLAIAVSAFAQTAKDEFQPEVGQEGKDVVWVPSPQPLVDKMLDMARVTPKDYLVDLGSGDGRTVISAAKRGARALGIEYNPDMVALSRRNAAKAGVSDKAQFVNADIFESDLSRATVITLFLLTDLNLRLRPKILSLAPGTRVVSNTFKMGDWEPDQTAELDCGSYCTAHLWIVPARIEGTWRMPQGVLAFTQYFQRFTGTLKAGAKVVSISGGRLRGDQVSFSAGDSAYSGRVAGDAIEGTVRSSNGTGVWKATR